MILQDALGVAVVPALSLLPGKMDTPAAKAMMLAVGLQESEFKARRQAPAGPARSYWQFEPIAVEEVLTNAATAAYAAEVLAQLDYRLTGALKARVQAVHALMEHNDALACAFARLLLWRLPDGLPGPLEQARGWAQYLDAWRPGKPHPRPWPGNFLRAWAHVA